MSVTNNTSKRRPRSDAFSPEQIEQQTSKTCKIEMVDPISNSDVITKLEQLINDNSQSVLKNIDTSLVSLSSKFEKSIFDLQSNINQIKDTLDDKLNDLQSEVKRNTSDISTLKNEIDRQKFKKEVYISGIPIVENENLSQIFGLICTAIGYTNNTTPIVFLHRLSSKNAPSSSNSKTKDIVILPPILVEFCYYNQCIEFKNKYFATKDLNLSCLGYQNSKRIFINERLTRHDMDIKFKALKLKKDNCLHSVLVSNGRVYIKPFKDSKRIHVDDVSALPIDNNK